MSAAETPISHPPCRRYQFRLRTLLVALLLVAIVCGLLARQIHEARRQRLIVERLREQGARVDVRDAPTSWPQWLDTDYLQRVRYVEMNGTRVEDFRLFVQFPNLEELYLWKTGIRDVTPLVGLKKLRVLDMAINPVSDIRPLAAVPTLEVLALAETNVRDFTTLRELKELRELYIYNMEIVDLAPLASLKHLEQLNLHHTPVSDVTPLTNLKNLRALDITYTKVSDQSLQELKAALPACEIRHYREE